MQRSCISLQFSNLVAKQFGTQLVRVAQHGTPGRINVPEQVLQQLENIVEHEKLRLYRMAPGNVLVVDVPPDLGLHIKHLILVRRSQQLRQTMLLAALRMADELKVSKLAIPYYMYAHAEKVAQDLVVDLQFADSDSAYKPSFLRKITFCALSKKDCTPFM